MAAYCSAGDSGLRDVGGRVGSQSFVDIPSEASSSPSTMKDEATSGPHPATVRGGE